MNNNLTFTGERFLPEVEGEIAYEHWHRYAFAQNLCDDRVVLDVACGEGYGSSLLAEKARKVVGVDISEEAVAHARKTYPNKNLEFIPGSCDNLPFADDSFDLAVSYETIEHIETQEEFLAELVRVLKPDGLLILSSPNKQLYSDAHDHHNEFHVKELYRDELKELLESQLQGSFPHIHWLGQKLLFHSTIWPEEQDFIETDYLQKNETGIDEKKCPDIEPMYYIVVCSRSAQEQPAILDRISLFAESSETIYQDYCKHIQRVIELDQLLKDRDKTLALRNEQMLEGEKLIEERDALLVVRTRQTSEFEEQIRERDGMLDLRTQQLTDKDDLIRERDDLLALRTRQMAESEALIAKRDALIAQRDDLLDLRTEQLKEAERLIVERDELLASRTQQMLEREEMIAERDAQLGRDAERIAEQDKQQKASNVTITGQQQQVEELTNLAAYRGSFNWWLKLPWQRIGRLFSKDS